MDIDLTSGCCTAKIILPTLFSHPNFSLPDQDYRNWVLVGLDLGIHQSLLKEIKETAKGKTLYDGFQVVTQLITEWVQEKIRNGEKALVRELVSALNDNRLAAFGEAVKFAIEASPENNVKTEQSQSKHESKADPLPLMPQQHPENSHIAPNPCMVQVKQEPLSDISDHEEDDTFVFKDKKVDNEPVRDEKVIGENGGAAKHKEDKPQKHIIIQKKLSRSESYDSNATEIISEAKRKTESNMDLTSSSSKAPNKTQGSINKSSHETNHQERSGKQKRKRKRSQRDKQKRFQSQNDLRLEISQSRSRDSNPSSRPVVTNYIGSRVFGDIDVDGLNRFHRAVKANRKEVVLELIQEKVNVNRRTRNNFQNTALHLAAWNIPDRDEVIEMIKILIKSGVVVEATNSNNATFIEGLFNPEVPHIPPINSEHFHELVKFLIQNGHQKFLMAPGINGNDCILHRAMRKSIMGRDTIAFLHYTGIGLNFLSETGNGMLYYAIVGKKNAKELQYLIDLGANWKHVNKEGCNLLHVAAQFKNLSAFEYFKKKDPKFAVEKAKNGRTPMDIYK